MAQLTYGLVAAPGLVVVFSFTYRGGREEWSQKYHLDSDFSDAADFIATADAFKTAVLPVVFSDVHVERIYGYHNTDNPSDYSRIYTSSNAGTFSMSGLHQEPGDSAVWIRWDTERRSSTGRRIFLRKYFHPAIGASSGDPDVVASTWITAAGTFATAATGTGWHSKHLAGPDGLVPGGGNSASIYTTTRTLKRR
jgi:hypothetical protein